MFNNQRCYDMGQNYLQAVPLPGMVGEHMPHYMGMPGDCGCMMICPPIEKVCNKQIHHHIKHIQPVHTRIVNHHVFNHVTEPHFTTSEEHIECHVGNPCAPQHCCQPYV